MKRTKEQKAEKREKEREEEQKRREEVARREKRLQAEAQAKFEKALKPGRPPSSQASTSRHKESKSPPRTQDKTQHRLSRLQQTFEKDTTISKESKRVKYSSEREKQLLAEWAAIQKAKEKRSQERESRPREKSARPKVGDPVRTASAPHHSKHKSERKKEE
ncbi:MAG: hypothetical protein GY820_41925, partial [Gammaproteobacteria bacterium]|nr:hypothetical protein [Gammaproteobacteria bacterium]